jgi:lipopolysaccharide/colanic/teichoic acid biosynthesis glycosyltransferase
VEHYKNWHYERLNTLPGITGLAQVMGRSSISFDQIARYDIQYVRKQNLYLDIQIVWWTFQTVLSGRGAG